MFDTMLQLLRWRRASTAAAGLAATAASPALGRDGDKNDDRRGGDGNEGDRRGRSDNGGRERDDNRDRSQDEAQRSRDNADGGNRRAEERQQADEGGGNDDDPVGGRIGEAADRLRRRGEKLTGADGSNRDAEGPEDDIAVTFDPATGGLDVATDNIALIRDDEGAITIDTDNIFFERGPDPEPTSFLGPGFPGVVAPLPTPGADGGDNDTDIVS